MANKKVVIASACRTAIGKMGGVLSTVPAVDLGATVIKEAVKRAGLKPEDVDHVYMGNVIQAGLGQNPARQASLKAGLPVTTPAVSVNVVCGSGLNCVNMAADMIIAGDADIVVAGGMENMSLAPYVLPHARFGYRMNTPKDGLVDAMVHDALWDAFNDYHMMVTAENVAKQWNLTREELDEFAANSQNKACAARDNGRFKDEIVPVEVNMGKKKGIVVVDTDEGPREGQTPEVLAKLRCCSGVEGGVVTAGNASGINDGASFTIVASEDAVKKYNLTPIAEVIGFGQGGVDPRVMGLGPTPAILNALKYADLKIEDLDLVELNEAFAAQSLGVIHELEEATGMDREAFLAKTNVNGGAIALGHPVGASGNRILVSLLYEMQKRKSKIGLASLCIGGGQGAAVIVKMCD